MEVDLNVILCIFFHLFLKVYYCFDFLFLQLVFWVVFEGQNSLNQIVNVCCKMAGMQLSDLSSLWEASLEDGQMVQVVQGINNQPDHILSTEFAFSFSCPSEEN